MTPDNATILQRYPLLCRALQATPDADDPQWAVADRLGKLEHLVHEALLELARQGSPDDFADIYLGFTEELRRFREFCAEPRLASKTIVAFGGAFSAGKSSLINALVGQRLMVTEVDPTTALPAYLFAGDADAVHALNLHGLRVPLTDDEFLSLTHDEPKRFGSEVARSLTAAFVTRRNFPWRNLAFIDTPGYTDQADGGTRSDARIAQAQLAGAHAIVWTVSIKQGDLTEADLHFLSNLDPAIPRIVAVTRADLVTEESRQKVVAQIRDTLATHNLPVVDVIPVSARPREAALLEPLRQQLDAWNQSAREQRFAHRFKALFVRYQRGLERELRDARWQLHRANRLATLADGEIRRDAEELQQVIEERVERLKTIEERLTDLRSRFFTELKRVGDLVGVPLPEPHEIELLDPGRSNLLEQLVALREREGNPEPDLRLILAPLAQPGEPQHRPLLLRRTERAPLLKALAVLSQPAEARNARHLLRRTEHAPLLKALGVLSAPAEARHAVRLLRRHRDLRAALRPLS
jgi:GTP-binding protein EngB required for normal cell division